ncbi:MAG: tetratricopeptide repeat protein [bacterium]
MPALEIEALLELSRLWLDMGKYKEAIQDADQALKLCSRTGFLLYEPEAELILAKAYLSQKDRDKAN